jgi:hypothetical protein
LYLSQAKTILYPRVGKSIVYQLHIGFGFSIGCF